MNSIIFPEIDTGNYTISAAIYQPESSTVCQSNKLLHTAQGELGPRHGDALFHHVINTGDRITDIMSIMLRKLAAVCILDKLGNAKRLYMLLFAGEYHE